MREVVLDMLSAVGLDKHTLGSIVSVLVELRQLLMQEFLTTCLSGIGGGEVKMPKMIIFRMPWMNG